MPLRARHWTSIAGPERAARSESVRRPERASLMMVGMDVEARRAAVAALLRLAGSSAYQDRADAGRALASFAEMSEAMQPLRRLLLDAGNTFVTLVTADALLRRSDPAGLALVARALTDADDNHADWIATAVQNVYMIYANERDAAVRICDALLEEPDPDIRQGAARLSGTLAAIDPVLCPPRKRQYAQGDRPCLRTCTPSSASVGHIVSWYSRWSPESSGWYLAGRWSVCA